ncbi:MAG: heavy metal translocating P-type ATPase [Gemmatimonadaceae bacterium]
MTATTLTVRRPGRAPRAVERLGVTPVLFAWPAVALVIIAGGWVVRMDDAPAGHLVWTIGLALCAGPVVVTTLRDARHGRFATDIVATLAIVTALLLATPIAGLVVVLMLRGGEALERYAEGRASEAVEALEAAAPRTAHRIVGADVSEIPASQVAIGDLLLIRPGELVPCDGVVTEGISEVDTSSLTGEPLPIPAVTGTNVMSGSLNGAGALRVRAAARAEQSQYARIVDLVRSAQLQKAPLQRMADRYAVWFTPVTLGVCAIAFAATGDWMRVLAVLVVATPCPLILAAPVAFVGGINRAANRHIVIRNGAALEQLSNVTAAVFDKTGTITLGEPRLSDVQVESGRDVDEILRLVAAVEQGSSHRLGRIVVDAAKGRGLAIPHAAGYREEPGRGVTGTVETHTVSVGSRSYVLGTCAVDADTLAHLESRPVSLRSYIGVDGSLAGVLEFAEELRADLSVLLASLRGRGVTQVVLLSGDHPANAQLMATRAGIADVRGDLTPQDKAEVVARMMRQGETVMMVGDGTNDAPALTQASVGVALAGHGGGITTEAADVIILNDSLSSVREAIGIGARTTRIAKQSIWVGLGLSGAAMIWAAAGGIAPVPGALLQEAVDVAVILNALRTLRGGT